MTNVAVGSDLACCLVLGFKHIGARPSIDKVRSNDLEKFPRVNDLGVLPELGQMPFVARNQVVRPSGISAFNKDVVGRIGGDSRQA